MNQKSMESLLPRFGINFLEDHARRIITDPKIALIELIANCWDAGANRVDIVWLPACSQKGASKAPGLQERQE